MLLVLVPATKFDETTYQLSVSKVIAVVKIEKNFIPTDHLLEVNVILKRNRLLINTNWLFPALNLDELGTLEEVLPEILRVTDRDSLTIDASLSIGCKKPEWGLEKRS